MVSRSEYIILLNTFFNSFKRYFFNIHFYKTILYESKYFFFKGVTLFAFPNIREYAENVQNKQVGNCMLKVANRSYYN